MLSWAKLDTLSASASHFPAATSKIFVLIFFFSFNMNCKRIFRICWLENFLAGGFVTFGWAMLSPVFVLKLSKTTLSIVSSLWISLFQKLWKCFLWRSTYSRIFMLEATFHGIHQTTIDNEWAEWHELAWSSWHESWEGWKWKFNHTHLYPSIVSEEAFVTDRTADSTDPFLPQYTVVSSQALTALGGCTNLSWESTLKHQTFGIINARVKATEIGVDWKSLNFKRFHSLELQITLCT